MTKKALEKRIEQLEKELTELKAQLLSLALRPTAPIYIPVPCTPPLPQPVYIGPIIPQITPWNPWPTITCDATSGRMQ
jgi:hypothetical protein